MPVVIGTGNMGNKIQNLQSKDVQSSLSKIFPVYEAIIIWSKKIFHSRRVFEPQNTRNTLSIIVKWWEPAKEVVILERWKKKTPKNTRSSLSLLFFQPVGNYCKGLSMANCGTVAWKIANMAIVGKDSFLKDLVGHASRYCYTHHGIVQCTPRIDLIRAAHWFIRPFLSYFHEQIGKAAETN